MLGNAVYTGYEMLKSRAGNEAEGEAAPPEDWSETPEPAQVGQRVAGGVFRRPIDLERADVVYRALDEAFD